MLFLIHLEGNPGTSFFPIPGRRGLPLNFVWLKQHLGGGGWRGEEGLDLLPSWTPQCSKGTIRAHSLRVMNELCSEVKYHSDLPSKEIKSTFKFPSRTCCPLWFWLSCSGALGALVDFFEVAGIDRFGLSYFNLDLAIRLPSGLPPLSPQDQPAPSLPSLVFLSSVTKPVRIVSKGWLRKALCSKTQRPRLPPAWPRLSPPCSQHFEK